MQEIKDQLKTKYQRKTKAQTAVKEEEKVEVKEEQKEGDVKAKVSIFSADRLLFFSRIYLEQLTRFFFMIFDNQVDHPIDIEDIWKRDLREIAEMRKNEVSISIFLACEK